LPLPGSRFALYLEPSNVPIIKVLVGVPAQPVSINLGSTFNGTLQPYVMQNPFTAVVTPNTFALLRIPKDLMFGSEAFNDGAYFQSLELVNSSSGEFKDTVLGMQRQNANSTDYQLSLDAPKANIAFDQVISDSLKDDTAYPNLDDAHLYTFDVFQTGKVTINLTGTGVRYYVLKPGNQNPLISCENNLGCQFNVSDLGKWAIIVDNPAGAATPYSLKLGFTP
jgi:hypothetical protein